MNIIYLLYLHKLNNKDMKKVLIITAKIIYTILALSPIFALGYMLGEKIV